MLAVLLHVSWNDASALTFLQCCFMYLEMMLQHSHAGSVAACLLTIKITSHSGTQQVTPRNMLAVLLHVDIWQYSRRMAIYYKCRRIVNKKAWFMHMQAQWKAQSKEGNKEHSSYTSMFLSQTEFNLTVWTNIYIYTHISCHTDRSTESKYGDRAY